MIDQEIKSLIDKKTQETLDMHIIEALKGPKEDSEPEKQYDPYYDPCAPVTVDTSRTIGIHGPDKVNVTIDVDLTKGRKLIIGVLENKPFISLIDSMNNQNTIIDGFAIVMFQKLKRALDHMMYAIPRCGERLQD